MVNPVLRRLAAVLTAGVLLQLALPHLSINTGLVVSCAPIAIACAYSVAGFIRQARTHTGRRRIGLRLGAFTGGMVSLSYVLYTVGALADSDALTFPGDVISTCASGFAMASVILAIPPLPDRLTRGTYLLDLVSVAGAIFVLSWRFALGPEAAELHGGGRLLFIGTVIPEIGAAALALTLLSRAQRGGHYALPLLSGGLGVFALATISGAYTTIHHLPWYAGGLGAAYFVGALTIALASRDTLPPPDVAGHRAVTGFWSVLPHLPVTLALGCVMGQYLVAGTLSPVLGWTVLGTSALAVVRQVVTARIVMRLVGDLDHQAHHDGLTGLPNRVAFYRAAAEHLAATAPGRVSAVLLLDLDRFKEVNDTLGHAAGDELLVGVASRLRMSLRHGDLAARLGGDEFALVLRDLTEPREAQELAARILADLAIPMKVGSEVMPVRGSIGISIAAGSDAPGSVDLRLREADEALYVAKDDGKGVARTYYSPALA